MITPNNENSRGSLDTKKSRKGRKNDTTLEQFLRDENSVIPGVRPLKNINLLKNMDPKMGVGVLLPDKDSPDGRSAGRVSPMVRTPIRVSIVEPGESKIPQGSFNPIGHRISSNSQEANEEGGKSSTMQNDEERSSMNATAEPTTRLQPLVKRQIN